MALSSFDLGGYFPPSPAPNRSHLHPAKQAGGSIIDSSPKKGKLSYWRALNDGCGFVGRSIGWSVGAHISMSHHVRVCLFVEVCFIP